MTMFEPEFYKTRMGQTYYEKTLPSLADEMAKLREAVKSLAAAVEGLKKQATQPVEDGGTETRG